MPEKLQSFEILETLHSSRNVWVKRAINKNSKLSVILKNEQIINDDDPLLSRLKLSFDILSNIKHKNIVQALEFIEENDSQTLVMKDIEGIDLSLYRHHFSPQRLPIEVFLKLAIQLADAISQMHNQQVIHKDLHPGNIIINPQSGQVQIIDFGLSSRLSREKSSLTPPEYIEGILDYISPEQTGRMNCPLDYRSDFYTLGVTFYELLSGELPFKGEDALGLVYAHIASHEKPLCEIDKNIPKALSDIISKLLKKSAEDRYQSSAGLKLDLTECLEALTKGKALNDFVPAQHDFSTQFKIPNKLYGRDKELKQLKHCFNQVINGSPHLLTVAGYSGIGKSSFINEIHKFVAESKGLYLTGVFDQYQNNQAYSAFKQAIKTWLQQILSKPEKVLIQLKKKYSRLLEGNTDILINFLTEFEYLLEKTDKSLITGQEERKNKLLQALLILTNEIAQETPLVIFIDNLQWADYASLELLKLLITESKGQLLIISAYRINEVESEDSVLQNLENVDKDKMSSIELGPLSAKDIQGILKDTLRKENNETKELSFIIHKKTAGNPFFINEFLKVLYSEGDINFDLKESNWSFNLKNIKDKKYTSNVIELIITKLKKLPKETKKVLQIASCIGNSFDLEILSKIENSTQLKTKSFIDHALKNDFIIESKARHRGNYKYSAEQPENHYSFLHDKILQAIHESIEFDVTPINLAIGRQLRSKYESAENKSTQLLIQFVEKLNSALISIESSTERHDLCYYNLLAAKQSKTALAWQEAVIFSKQSENLFSANPWESDYKTAFDTLYIQAECHYLTANIDEANRCYSILLEHCKSNIERARIYEKQLVEFIGQGNWSRCIALGHGGLEALDIEIPTATQYIQQAINKEKLILDKNIQRIKLDNIEVIKKSSDEKQQIISNIITNLCATYLIIGKDKEFTLYIYTGMNLIYKNGINNETVALLSWYAVLLTHHKRLFEANIIAEIALNFIDKYPQSNQLASSLNILALYIKHCQQPYSETLKLHSKAYEIGMKRGEIARSVISLGNMLPLLMSKGDNLSKIHKKTLEYESIAQNKSLFVPIISHVKSFTLGLIIPNKESEYLLDDKQIGEEQLNRVRGSIHETNRVQFKSLLKFWHGNTKEALIHFNWYHKKTIDSAKFNIYLDHLTLYALCIFIEKKTETDGYKQDLKTCFTDLKTYCDLYQKNSQHKYKLIEAELSRANDKSMDSVINLYDLSIKSAKENNFIQYQAIATERLACYLKSKNLELATQAYFKAAVNLYEKWGCYARIKFIEKTYHYFSESSPENHSHHSSSSRSKSNTNSNSSRYNLDIDSVIKSSHVISSELNSKNLASKIMAVILENSGAQSGAFILNTKNGISLEAHLNPSGPQLKSSIPIEQAKNLPVEFISYILRTEKTFIKQDDSTLYPIKDSYLTKECPKSVLFTPVEYRGKTVGVLYLEHKSSAMAFPKSRLDIIQILLKQAAISLENSHLFEQINTLNKDLEIKVEERTLELQTTRDQLIQSERMASLAALTTGISHEINTPLGNSITSASFNQSLLNDLDNSFKQKTLSSEELSDFIINAKNSDDIVRSSLEKINNLVTLFKTISIGSDNDSIEKDIFYPYEQLKILKSDFYKTLNKGQHKLIINGTKEIKMCSFSHAFDQVFSQLITNSIIHGFENKKRGRINISLNEEDEMIIIEINDNGCGMPASLAQSIFDPFVTTKRGNQRNMGLGGNILFSQVVHKLKGQIECSSTVGKGTRFIISLPKNI